MTAAAPRKRRRTKVEMTELRQSIYDLVEENRPCSVRQLYYLGTGRLWEKDRKEDNDRNYRGVVRETGLMREDPPHGLGTLPWEWITDSTRYCRIPTMYDSPRDAVERTAEEYRRHLWAQQPRHVEVWAESDSVSGIVDLVTRALGVGLFSCRGQASKTFAQSSAQQYRAMGKPVTILYVGDWDPTGLAIPRSLHERVLRYSGDAEVELRRVAVTAEDVRRGDLQAHYVNERDPNYRRFAEHCRLMDLDPQNAVEVEAIPPATLRGRLETVIYDLVEDAHTWNATIAAEESERELFLRIVEDYWPPEDALS